MCFELGSCFGNGRREDFGGEWSTTKAARGGRGRGRRGNRGNDAYYTDATDHKAPPAAYYNQPHAGTLNEAGHKAYHDTGRKDHHVATGLHAGGHGGYTAYVQDKAEHDTPKLPAWHNKVRDNGGNTNTYTTLAHKAATDNRENAAMDYHHYPAMAMVRGTS